jgi:hypothetical protein
LLDGAFETRPDSGKEVRFRDRFGQVIIRPKAHAGANVGFLAFRGEEDKWNSDRLWVGTKSGYDAVSIQLASSRRKE